MNDEKLEALEEAKKEYLNRYAPEEGMDERDALNIGLFMGKCISLFKAISDELRKWDECMELLAKNMNKLLIIYNVLEKRVKKLEQAKTEDKHQALLNNCVDDDEAILHKREIECPKGFTEKVMAKINNEGER